MKKLLGFIYRFLFENHAKYTTICTICLSAWYRFKILVLPKKRLEQSMGSKGEESTKELPLEDLKTAYRIGSRVERACEHTPWESKCLVKALTAAHLLKKKHLPYTLYLGLGKENDKLIAHAWLRSGQVYITGGNGNPYANVAKYSVHFDYPPVIGEDLSSPKAIQENKTKGEDCY